jgi:hypothetical protein
VNGSPSEQIATARGRAGTSRPARPWSGGRERGGIPDRVRGAHFVEGGLARQLALRAAAVGGDLVGERDAHFRRGWVCGCRLIRLGSERVWRPPSPALPRERGKKERGTPEGIAHNQAFADIGPILIVSGLIVNVSRSVLSKADRNRLGKRIRELRIAKGAGLKSPLVSPAAAGAVLIPGGPNSAEIAP